MRGWLILSLSLTVLVCTSFVNLTGSVQTMSFASLEADLESGNSAATHTIEKITRINHHISEVGAQVAVSHSPSTPCVNCMSTQVARNLNYRTCNASNDYLESALENLKTQNNLIGQLASAAPRANSLIKQACTETALERSSTDDYVTCESGEPVNHQKQPCVSESYVALMHNSLDTVGRCLLPMMSDNDADQKEDMREIFGLFVAESGLHLNALSPTGAAGSGQFTQSAIDDINRNMMSKVRSQLTATNSPAVCQEINSTILARNPPMRSSVADRCDRTSLAAGNPVLNMVYTFAAVADYKKMVASSVLNQRHFADSFDQLSPSEKNRLNIILAVWAHNSGPAGLNTPLHALLNSTYRDTKVTDVDQFLKEMSQAMKTYPNSANANRGRENETSKYVPTIQKTLNGLDVAGGGSCVQ